MGTADLKAPQRFEFDDLTLDTGQCRLWRDDRVVPLSKLTFALLRLLVERAPNLVGHDECALHAWGPRRVVTPENLAQRIMMLRQALGDNAAKPRYIEGVRGEGYRLVPVVRIASDVHIATVPSARSTNRRRPALLYTTIATGVALSAVLLLAILWPGGRAQPPIFTALTFDGGFKKDLQLDPSGEMLAFSWDGPEHGNRDVYVKQIGRDTATIRITDDPAEDVEPVWSPDGRRLAFIRIAEGRSAIFIAPAFGGRANKLIDISGRSLHINHRVPTLSWSADGRFMVYAEKPDDGGPARLVWLDIGSLERRLLTSPALKKDALGDFQPSISPDGKRVAYVRGQSQYANLNVWTVDIATGAETRITNQPWEFCERLSWLRGGREVLLTAGSLFDQRVYALRIQDGRLRALPGLGENDRWAVSQSTRVAFAKISKGGLRIWQAATSPNRQEQLKEVGLIGSKLVFSPNGEMLAWQSRLTGLPQVWIAERSGAHPRPLTRQRTPAFDPQWSPDGERIAFESHDFGNADVYTVDVSSGRVRRLTSDPSEDRWPTYSKDGRFIYFTSHRDGAPRIYKMSAEGGIPIAVTRSTGFHATQSSDSRFLYFSREEDSSVWRAETGGLESKVLTVPDWNRGWTLASNGIYYLSPTDQGFAIRYYNLTSGDDSELHRDWGRAYYLTLTSDEQHVLFSREDRLSSDLFVVDQLTID